MKALIRFTIENFRSISERKSLLLTPSSIKDEPITNVIDCQGVKYLRTAAIYGANSSGKSNLVRGLDMMCSIVKNSVKINNGESLPYNPFALNKEKEQSPTLFEIDFIIDDTRYRYGFSNDERRICEEWLVKIEKTGKENNLFIRTIDGIGIDEKLFHEGKDLELKTNDNRLFLSLVGQLGGSISNSIIRFFSQELNVIYGLKTEDYNDFTRLFLNKKLSGCNEMNLFFNKIQLGFESLSTAEKEFDSRDIPNDLPKEIKEKLATALFGIKKIEVFSQHPVYDDDGNKISSSSFDFDEMESDGTKKIFDIAGPIFDTLINGRVLVIDELDAKMHPLISRELVSLFNDTTHNQNGAQLIFTTHDTNLLSSKLLRRDQIWFTEKDSQERTDLYNMMQIVLPDGTKPRGDGNIERNYINGRYGAIPYI